MVFKNNDFLNIGINNAFGDSVFKVFGSIVLRKGETEHFHLLAVICDSVFLFWHQCFDFIFAVYIYLADRTNENNECWPAIPTIAADLKYSPSTVRRGIRDLKKAGLLETEQRYRKKGGKSSLLFRLKKE